MCKPLYTASVWHWFDVFFFLHLCGPCRPHHLFHSSQLLEHKTPLSVYFHQISIHLSPSSLTSLTRSVPFLFDSFSSLAAWHFTALSGDSCAKWSYWESATVNSRRPHVMCLKHRWTAQVSNSRRKRCRERRGDRGRGRSGGWTDNRIILCFVWGRVSKQ